MIRPLSPNVLTLDYCDLTFGKQKEEDVYFYDAQLKIFQSHGIDQNPWDSAVQFKTNILDKDNFSDDSGFDVDFWFEVIPGVNIKTLNCVVERPELYKVYCNGTEIHPEPNIWWLDRAFAVFDISKLAKIGKNRITLKAKPFTIHTELEPLYILGDFDLESMQKGFRLIPSKAKKLGSWKTQGMPFYADGVSYEKDFVMPSSGIEDGDRYFVHIEKYAGAVSEVLVNDENAGFIAFEPFELDITENLKAGQNHISVVVYGTLKNTLGPHHNNPKPGTAWPSHFRRGAKGGRPPGSKYSVMEYGLFKDFSFILRK